MTNPLPRILVVDDEQHQLDSICRGLLLYGYRCQCARSVEAALVALASEGGDRFQLIVTDLTMPGHSGLELIERVRQDWPDRPFVVLTGLGATAELGTVQRMKIPLLRKPFDPDALDAAVRRALKLG